MISIDVNKVDLISMEKELEYVRQYFKQQKECE